MRVVSTSTASSGQAPAPSVTGQQRRALRKLLRDLVVFTGTAINDLAAAPHKAPQRKSPPRLLYRRAATLADSDLDAIVADIGIDRMWAAVERATQPRLPLVAAE